VLDLFNILDRVRLNYVNAFRKPVPNSYNLAYFKYNPTVDVPGGPIRK